VTFVPVASGRSYGASPRDVSDDEHPLVALKAQPKASLCKAFWHARETVGLPDVTIHDLRHAGATLAAWTGASTKELMARLGHALPRAAPRYQHAAATHDIEIARRLDDVFEAARDGRAMERETSEAKIDENEPDLGL
jgi:integrase